MLSFLISLIFGLSVSLLIWSGFALLHRGKNYEQIKNSLSDILNSSLDLILKVKNLFVLLIKDSIQSNTVEFSELLTNKTFRKQKTASSTIEKKLALEDSSKVIITDSSLTSESPVANESNIIRNNFGSESIDSNTENHDKAA